MSTLRNAIAADLEYVAEIRHDLHAHPELGYNEHRTCGVVTGELDKIGVKYARGLAKGTGVLAYLPATTVNPDEAATIALRADMDALPIHEQTGKPYSSENEGVMHACGHDGHTSILIGTARALAKSERPNNVILVFQPAEEGGAGGEKMCEDGALDGSVIGKPVDRIFGLHGFPLGKLGTLGTRTGPLLASADGFEMTVRGRGGHAAAPHLATDPVLTASHIVVALQSIASRNVSPLDSIVVTIGQIVAGTANNIIPDDAKVVGTLRTLKAETRALGMKRIREIAENVAAAFGATIEIEWLHGYPVTFNDAVATREFRSIVGEAMGSSLLAEEVEPVMGGEDFSFYGKHVPACFYWLGLLNEGQERYPNLHAPDFDFNDKAIPVGIEAMCALALGSYEKQSAPQKELVAQS